MSEEGAAEGRPSSCHLLVIADGLAEPPSPRTTMALAKTPALDRLARSGILCRIDPQEGVPAGRTTSERGIARLLDVSARESDSLPRASLLSLLLDQESLTAPFLPPRKWFFLATPVLCDTGGRLARYVNDPESEHDFWTGFLEKLPVNPSFGLFPLRKENHRISRMLLALSFLPPAGRREGSPPRSGLDRSEGGDFPEFREVLGPQEGLADGSFAWRLDDPSRAVNQIWLWGGGPPLTAGQESRAGEGNLKTGQGVLVGDALLVRALGLWKGYRAAPLVRSTGDVDTDLGEKMNEVIRAVRSGAGKVVLHLEGFDMASHRRNSPEKIRFLERADREVFAPILAWLRTGLLTSVRVTSDHQSSPGSGNHEPGPVPALFCHRTEGINEEAQKWTGGPPGGSRMTETAALDRPLVPVDEWNKWPFRFDNGLALQNGGKDLCLASS